MTTPADEILQAGVRDAQTALMAIQAFGAHWEQFTEACRAQQFDLAAIYGERVVAFVESGVDLYQSSHRRIAQFTKLTQGADDE